ncbi:MULTISPECIES: wax ester/triacylglycerol synthase family O-acyltransferase [unclassified Rhodococcus (in: high G+C Gram-positive bacteria)]|uniref:WS/DGAT/MGAT family O-acyltransferase n=1 Tax=unclassified Rhodococcus (in: high G+C Gram-positive bacteria) TaxID=192944 RepID=UPI00163ACB42|nr:MULTISPECIES: wax ester/triacylglycerol synthase family O-acyltransferase [unclassified Rhodococcus (in: high G+C Gram-positive bacteria)]MBC2644324.1 wax ester/triacylglycerol synthase family O-acyltransferase [Rhodococcus sp. 3A]MBC2897983.1 wax ester/triacylglycerol synthase family O-acyltransferase [Rhodococcus sp. 4CII]
MLLPMSPTDSMFLLGESREHPMHVGGLAVFTPPDGADARAVREMFEAAVADGQVTPLFRTRARRSLTSLGQWGWDTTDHVDLDHHIRRDALPRPGGTAELLTLVSRLHATLLDRSRPLWEMHLIEGLADGRYAVYTKIHHALADGASAMSLLRRSMSEDPDRRNMPAPWQPTRAEDARARLSTPVHPAPSALAEIPNPLALPGQLLRAARGVAGEIAGLAPAVAAAVDRALDARGGPLSLGAPHTMFNVPIGGARHFAGRSWPLERVRLLAKHADATVNDIVLALCGGALRRFLDDLGALPADPLIAMVPVNLRGSDTDTGRAGAERAGNRVGMLMCNLATHLPDPAHRLETIRTCMREGKAALRGMSQAQALAVSALGAAPLGLELLTGRRGPHRPPFNLVISNVAGPSTPLYWNGARLDALYPLSIPVTGQALNITCTSTDDQLVFGLTGCRAAVPNLHPMLDHLHTELRTLETVVGL